jgi:mannose/fructose/N-acetylgalactosamine-specific phosphotransferase system component IIC
VVDWTGAIASAAVVVVAAVAVAAVVAVEAAVAYDRVDHTGSEAAVASEDFADRLSERHQHPNCYQVQVAAAPDPAVEHFAHALPIVVLEDRRARQADTLVDAHPEEVAHRLGLASRS